VRQLTDNDTVDGRPAWSPDGTRIAFDSVATEIFVMNADGTEEGYSPSWGG
jgi:Tol biopolymer transport system component